MKQVLRPYPNVQVQTRAQFEHAQAAQVNQLLGLIYALLSLAVIIAVIGIVNTLMLSVLDRRREIGVLRAIGSTRRFTLNAILAEAAGIGVVGGTLGMILGGAIQYLISVAMTNVLSIDVAWKASPMMIVIGLFAVSWISYYYYEKKFLILKDRFK